MRGWSSPSPTYPRGRRPSGSLEAARSYSDSIISTIRQPLVVLDEELCVISASRSFYSTFSVEPEQTVGRQLDAVDEGRLDIAALRSFLEQQLADIQALGVSHMIDLGLHTHEKALPDEAASVGQLGMTYIHIPVNFQDPTDEDFAKFCSAMEQLKEVPVLPNSAFFYRYRRDVLGMNEAKARAEMEKVWHPNRQDGRPVRRWSLPRLAAGPRLGGNLSMPLRRRRGLEEVR